MTNKTNGGQLAHFFLWIDFVNTQTLPLPNSQHRARFTPTKRVAPPVVAATGSSLQLFFAQAAIFLLPLPALKYTSTSIILADLFLLPAIVMNLGYALRQIYAFQVPLLLAFPFFLLSHLLDPDCELITIFQICYVWGLLVPFGWCAFVNVPVRRIAYLVLASNVLSIMVAIGQFVGFIPNLPTQKVIEFKGSLRRAAGLMLQCNALAMSLTPCFLLLPYLPRVWPRIATCLSIFIGYTTTVSKSVILAVPGMLFYFLWREPEKRKFLFSAVVVALIGLGVLSQSSTNIWQLLDLANDAAQARLLGAENSFDERSNLVQIALEYSRQCLLLGFGTEGTMIRISENTGNTVHVFYLGLVVIAGYPAAALVTIGMLLIIGTLWMQRDYNLAIYLVAQMLALCVMTVLYVSFQYAPLMIAASVLAANDMRASTQRLQRRSLNS